MVEHEYQEKEDNILGMGIAFLFGLGVAYIFLSRRTTTQTVSTTATTSSQTIEWQPLQEIPRVDNIDRSQYFDNVNNRLYENEMNMKYKELFDDVNQIKEQLKTQQSQISQIQSQQFQLSQLQLGQIQSQQLQLSQLQLGQLYQQQQQHQPQIDNIIDGNKQLSVQSEQSEQKQDVNNKDNNPVNLLSPVISAKLATTKTPGISGARSKTYNLNNLNEEEYIAKIFNMQ